MSEKPKRKRNNKSRQSILGCGLFGLLMVLAFGICMIGFFVYVQQDLINSNTLITYIEADGEDAHARITEYLGTDLPVSATDFHWYSQRGFTSDSELEFSFQLPASEVQAWVQSLDFCFDIAWSEVSDNFRISCGDNPRYSIYLDSREIENWIVTIHASKS